MDTGIFCFQHCGPKVFCKVLPLCCPSCKADLSSEHDFELMPFRVPFPFVRASQYSCSVLIKPTHGDFLNDYYNSKDLHIGVTSSKGSVIEFDKTGLHKDGGRNWNQCLLIGQMSSLWASHWDLILEKVCSQDDWTAETYNENAHNCYSFVLAFLQQVQCGDMSKLASCRTAFCEKFIVPRTTAAGKYISLYRRLRNQNTFIHCKSGEGIVQKLCRNNKNSVA